MFHANDILLHSCIQDEYSIKNKFSNIVQSIINELQVEHLDRLIYSAIKYAPPEARIEIIDGIIRSRCNYLKTLPKLSINEQYHILARTNFDLVDIQAEATNPVFVNLVYASVRDLLLS